ncbi:hypothetical protein Trydic_g20878 [Trypoxylus dichotomus]
MRREMALKIIVRLTSNVENSALRSGIFLSVIPMITCRTSPGNTAIEGLALIPSISLRVFWNTFSCLGSLRRFVEKLVG